ncbi:MAG: hypothetical protein RBR37_05340 [Advenella sp.]|nr:hypothetical protein [Advenella sp.]
MRTLEERIKFDHGLVIGDNLVTLTHAGNEKTAIVNIDQLNEMDTGAGRLIEAMRDGSAE